MSSWFGQLMMIGISGESLTKDEKKFIIDHNISGVVLFARNVKEPKQIYELCSEIQSLRHEQKEKLPLLIGIDMEGGRVRRLGKPFTPWPAAKKLGDLDNPAATFNFAVAMGAEMHAVGINLNFAPCLDVLTNPTNTAIGDRAISSDFRVVEKHSSAIVRGFLKAELITCAKHFPGHGNTVIDSHDDLPEETTDLNTLQNREFVPFKKALRSKADMIMMAHILNKNIDPDLPASLSSKYILDILREDFRYRGVVVTDDLDMGALLKHFSREEIPVKALKAGCDLLLYCNDPTSPPIALESITEALAQGVLPKPLLEAAHSRISKLKIERLKKVDPYPFNFVKELIGNSEHLKMAEDISAGRVPIMKTSLS